MFQIKVFDTISDQGLQQLPAPEYSFCDDVAQADAIVVRSSSLHELSLSPRIKAVARAGAGVNNIPVDELAQRGVPVFNAPGANANAVKELVLAGMLLAARNLPGALSFVRGLPDDIDVHAYVEANKKRFVGSELAGRTLAVVGLGAIGVKVANAALALDMNVIGLDPHMTVDGAWQLSSGVRRGTTLDELYQAADYISFHVPLNGGTRGLLDHAALARLRPGTVIINFSREGIIATDVVLAGLANGSIARYVCDFPAAELVRHPQVVALPHLGASTAEAEQNCAVIAVNQLRSYLEHGNIENAVNLPSIRMPRQGAARIVIANRNQPNMIGQLTHVLGVAGMNISQMRNASRGELAVNLIDVDSAPPDSLADALRAIDGIISVRMLAAA